MSSAVEPVALVEHIDALLPQTQCTKCGYAGCRPYAEAIAGGAEINQCPPGGAVGIAKLAALLQRPILPLNPANGREGPWQVAAIDEALCIDCALCIDACPVDAIVGAPKRMHTVIAARCTGCDLCLPPCPMDCIAMVDAGRDWTEADARAARGRHAAHLKRLAETGDSPRRTSRSNDAPPPADAALGNMVRFRVTVQSPSAHLASHLAIDSGCTRAVQLRLPQSISGVPTATVFLPLGICLLGAGPAQLEGL